MYVKPIVRLALEVSAQAHKDQVRKGTHTPYIVHPVGVMLVCAEYTNSPETLAAALLHDVLEDCADVYSEDQMRREFGNEITGTVLAVTKDASITDWRNRNEQYLVNLRAAYNGSALLVSLADKVSNLVDVLEDHEAMSGAMWEKFNAGKDEQLWWYDAVHKLMLDTIPDHPLVLKYGKLVDELAIIVHD